MQGLLLLLLLIFSSYTSTCQETKPLEKVVIGEDRYILHTVQKNQTLYSIARFYACTQEEVLAANKHISGVIKKGMVLKIPDHTYLKPPSAKNSDDKFLNYLTVSGDNFYQLKLRYGVDEAELLKYNPELKEGLKAGSMLRIPIKSRVEVAATEPPADKTPPLESPVPFKAKDPAQTMHVGLYLPISAAITDSLKPSAKTLSFLAFYQGALMAVDQLTKTGMKVKLYVYDTEKSSSNVESLVKKPEFLSLDVLIGPVYPENQRIISELSAKNRIPMVSPLSTEDKYTKSNAWYFQVNPVKKLRIEATADYILKEFTKDDIFFLEGGSGSSDTRQIREYISEKNGNSESAASHLKAYNIWTKGVGELESQLSVDKPNILVMADHNEVSVSVAMNRLTLLSKKYPLILIGVQEFTRMQSIETENLHSVNLRYLSTYFVNYNLPSVSSFVENFKGEFGTEPSLFAFQGYDVTTFFLKSLNREEKLPRMIASTGKTSLLHTSYHFTKLADFGGYTNDSFTVVEYSNTFEVRSLGDIRSLK
jgi:ABC-type branched-subunit amino acid transport system substrate-binding protein